MSKSEAAEKSNVRNDSIHLYPGWWESKNCLTSKPVHLKISHKSAYMNNQWKEKYQNTVNKGNDKTKLRLHCHSTTIIKTNLSMKISKIKKQYKRLQTADDIAYIK